MVPYLGEASRQQPCKSQVSNFSSTMGVVETCLRMCEILISPATTMNNNNTNIPNNVDDSDNNLNVMSSDAIPDVNQRVQETAFNDAAVVSNTESSAPDTDMSSFNELSSIINFLKRPTLLWQSRISSTTPSLIAVTSLTGPNITQTPVKSFLFPYDLMALGQKMEKIRNFEWFKADIRLRVLVNANPFIAGRLWITFSPVNAQNNTATIQDYARINKKGRVGITSYPGVELDLQTTTAAELTIPWIAEVDAEQASLERQKLYRCDIWMLTPLLVADNSLQIPIQVYASFENIQLKFPTPVVRSATRQVLRESKGPITEISSGVSNLARKLGNLPLVGTIASKVGWASDMVNGVASALGWSRPIEGSHACAFAHIPGRGMANFKAQDSAVVLGMSADNEIGEKQQNFISDVDEMDISHICSRPGLIDVIDWSTGDNYQKTLGEYNASRMTVEPNIKELTINEETGNVYDPTLAEFVLQNFEMYRADWTFRITLVKTAFHVGRFEVFFIPNSHIREVNSEKLDTSNCYRQIFDITEQSEMTFEVPYLHRYLMLNRNRPHNYSFDQEETVGTLVIRVVSPLTCPDTVSQSIKILVWKSASNVAVAQPSTLDLPPFLPRFNSLYEAPRATRQINVQNVPKNTHYVVFDRQHNIEDEVEICSTVAGEMCVNLREATRGFRKHAVGLISTAQDPTCLVPNTIDFSAGGYLSVCSQLFYFFRGGLSAKILDHQSLGLRSWFSTKRNTIPFGSTPFHITPSNNPVHEITVPFYSVRRRQVCSKQFTDNQRAIDDDMPIVAVTRLDGTNVKPSECTLFLAGKDDLTFGFLVGVPLQYQKLRDTPST